MSRINPQDWTLEQVLTEPLSRPFDVRFQPETGTLHIVDFGWFEMGPAGVNARAGSGAVWRIVGKL